MFLALTGLNAKNEEILCQEKIPETLRVDYTF